MSDDKPVFDATPQRNAQRQALADDYNARLKRTYKRGRLVKILHGEKYVQPCTVVNVTGDRVFVVNKKTGRSYSVPGHRVALIPDRAK